VEEPGVDLALLLRGRAKLVPARPDVAVSALSGEEVRLEPGELELLLAVPTDRWVRDEDAGDPAFVRRLAVQGLLVSDEPDPLLVELRRRDERLTSPPWNIYAALHRAMTAWRDVEVAVSDEQSSGNELALELARGSPAFVERHGPPPSHFHHVAEPRPLPPAEREGALYDALRGRSTTRGFEPGARLTAEELSLVLRYVWGCHGTARLGEDVVVLKKTSPSGGSLHPIEVYPLVRSVDGIEPGLYHYSVEHHALELLERLEESETEALARSFLGGQWYFASAQVIFVMAARFHRSFWKYRDHEKAYTAILIDAGHLSQTFYLVCADLGLGAFVAGAINDATIDERLGLRTFEEGSLVICGCGRPAPSGLEPRFEPYLPQGLA
jgi:putative peptide maturation dehydrogenase